MGKLSKMNMAQLTAQYQEQLNIVKGQMKDMEQKGAAMDWHKYRQLKQMKYELQANIRQMKRYAKKG